MCECILMHANHNSQFLVGEMPNVFPSRCLPPSAIVPRLRTHGFVASDRPQPRFDSGRNGSNGGVKRPFGVTINGRMHGDISNNMRTYGNIIGYSGI